MAQSDAEQQSGPGAMARAAQIAALTTVLVGLVELRATLSGLSPRALLGVVALCVALGAALGLGLSAYVRATSALRAPVAYACDAAVGAGLAAFLFDALGILAKWQGETLALAQLAALGACGLGYAWALGLAAARAILREPRRPVLRVVTALGAACTAGALSVVAGVHASRQYPALGRAMRVSELGLFALSALVLWAGRSRARMPARPFALLVACAALAGPWLLSGRSDLHRLLQSPLAGTLLDAARRATDVDRDGASSLFGAFDCRPFDAKVRALARDVPGDGIDQDCRGGDRVARPRLEQVPRVHGQSPRPSIVLVTVDTLRADRMSVYGAARDTTPALESWAQGAVRYARTYTSGGWTSLALPSLLRGLHPRRLTWTRVYETDTLRLLRAHEAPLPGESVRLGFALPLEDRHPTLNALLGAAGYATAAIVDGGVTSYFRRELGVFRGFDTYVELGAGKVDEKTTDAALTWLDGAPQDRPFFLWTHYFGPHGPTSRHPGLRDYGDDELAGYDTEIAHLDVHLGRLLARLDALARTRPLAVIVTSDHGEEFTGEGREHGLGVAEGAVRIPLFVRAPGLAAGVHEGVTSLTDVMPTALALAGVAGPANLDGYDLLAPASPTRVVRFETWRLDRHGDLTLDLVGASDGHGKVTLDALRLDEAAFDLAGFDERDVPFTPRHDALLDALYDALGEDGPPRFRD